MKKVRTCRSCGSGELLPFLSLGHLPIPEVLALDRLDMQETRLPIELGFCKRCLMVQLLGESAHDPTRLYGRLQLLGLPTEPHRGKKALPEDRWVGLKPGAQVLCLQSVPLEDLLRLRQAGMEVLYIESVPELARQAQARGIPTRGEIFDRTSLERLQREGFHADAIWLGEALAHAADLNSYLEGLATLLGERGTLVLELPNLREWLGRRQFNCFSQRQLHYFSAQALQNLLRRHGFWLNDLQTRPDGALLAHASRTRFAEPLPHLDEEQRLGLANPVYYQEFASAVASVREALLVLLTELRARGRRIAAYGAGEPGSLMLNFVGLGREIVEFVIDDDPARQGRYVPGVRIPIYAPGRLLEEQPEYLLVLSGSHSPLEDSEFVARGGKLIVPLPYPEILNPSAKTPRLQVGT